MRSFRNQKWMVKNAKRGFMIFKPQNNRQTIVKNSESETNDVDYCRCNKTTPISLGSDDNSTHGCVRV